MERKVAGRCIFAMVLGIIAVATGFAAEATKVKKSDIRIGDDKSCDFPSSPALALGIVAAVFTIITRIYISVSFGDQAGCCRTDPNTTSFSKLLFVLSWVASVIAVVLSLIAAVQSKSSGQGVFMEASVSYNDKPLYSVDNVNTSECYVLKSGIFVAGAILALLSVGFGVTAYLCRDTYNLLVFM